MYFTQHFPEVVHLTIPIFKWSKIMSYRRENICEVPSW